MGPLMVAAVVLATFVLDFHGTQSTQSMRHTNQQVVWMKVHILIINQQWHFEEDSLPQMIDQYFDKRFALFSGARKIKIGRM